MALVCNVQRYIAAALQIRKDGAICPRYQKCLREYLPVFFAEPRLVPAVPRAAYQAEKQAALAREIYRTVLHHDPRLFIPFVVSHSPRSYSRRGMNPDRLSELFADDKVKKTLGLLDHHAWNLVKGIIGEVDNRFRADMAQLMTVFKSKPPDEAPPTTKTFKDVAVQTGLTEDSPFIKFVTNPCSDSEEVININTTGMGLTTLTVRQNLASSEDMKAVFGEQFAEAIMSSRQWSINRQEGYAMVWSSDSADVVFSAYLANNAALTMLDQLKMTW